MTIQAWRNRDKMRDDVIAQLSDTEKSDESTSGASTLFTCEQCGKPSAHVRSSKSIDTN
jgi:hypothetical protein